MSSDRRELLISPYGGHLVDLLVPPSEREALMAHATSLPSLQLTSRNVCDLELLATGAFSPLTTFMGKSDYDGVLQQMRLHSGLLWPLPITLTADPKSVPSCGEQVALRDLTYNVLAVMEIHEIFHWDPIKEATLAYGTSDIKHPMVAEMGTWGRVCISGPLRVLQLPKYYDFPAWRHTPRQLRSRLQSLGQCNVVGFQTRNPLHRVHEEMTKRAAEAVNGVLVLHPVVGLTKPGDVDHYTRARVYIALYEQYYDASRTVLSFLPLAMRMAGPKEALLHAIIRRNHGMSHFIVGRDHAGPGDDSFGKPFYHPYRAQDCIKDYEKELGITMVPFQQYVYVKGEDRYVEVDKVPAGVEFSSISGTQVRDEYLAKGKLLPHWFTRPETAAILRLSYPPRFEQGFCLWFTGLSGAGKSTIASILQIMLLENARTVTVLDGDVVRTHLSKGLGFSKEDRITNNLRIAFVASAIVSHRGCVIVAAISPYRDLRQKARNMVGENFIEVFVDTPLETCEQRDSKGLYAKARSAMANGRAMGFTGIDDPYEEPTNPEIRIEPTLTPDQAAVKIVAYLRDAQFLLALSQSK